MRGKLTPIAVGLLLVVAALYLQFSSSPLIRQAVARLDYLAYDLRLKAMLEPGPVDERVVIIDVDEKSLRSEGHWPWSRDRLAVLVDKLFAQGVVVIAFDMVFAEAERNPAQQVVARLAERGVFAPEIERMLGRHEALFDNNVVFAEQIAGRDVVLGYIFGYGEQRPKGVLPRPVALSNTESLADLTLPRARSYIANAEAFGRDGIRGGFFSLLPDGDGIIRRTPMLHRFGDGLYPSLALETVRLFLRVDELKLQTAQVGRYHVVEQIRLADHLIPTDSLGRAMVPYHGPKGSYRYVSAADVLNDSIERPEALAGTIALVGTTAQGLFDLRATPVQGVYPGVEVHANVISGILDNAFPVEPSWASGANFSLTLLTGLILAGALPFLSSAAMLLFAAAVGGGVVALNFWAWSAHGLILSLAPLVVLVSGVGLFNVAYGFLVESSGRRRLKDMFGQYVPPELVDEMNRNPAQSYGFEGESREMSVLFCDIRSFTTISERLTASRLKTMLNAFFTPMTRIIFEHRGTIDKYVGDMIMAFWGAPVQDEHHARHAITAALTMLETTEAMKPEFAASGLPEVNIGIGINTGLMNVGDMGSEYRRAYTVLGDSVNLASRLEGTTKYYGVGLVVGESTRTQAGDYFVYRELDRVRVKGKAQAITVYEPVCRREEADAALLEEIETYSEALDLFRARRWEAATTAFQVLAKAHPECHLYGLYLERLRQLEADDPGPDWDGVYERTTK